MEPLVKVDSVVTGDHICRLGLPALLGHLSCRRGFWARTCVQKVSIESLGLASEEEERERGTRERERAEPKPRAR